MSEAEPKKMPGSSPGEWALTVAKVGASFIPVVGGAAAELLGAIVTPQLEKRRTAWFENIANGLYKLQEQVAELTPERLAQDETWTTVFLTASQAALRTHQREKLEALRNAVLNAVLPSAPDDELQLIFLSFIDTFTPWHLRLLAYLDGPAAWMERHSISLPANAALDGVTLVDWAFPELHVRDSYFLLHLQQLAAQGLLRDNWNEASPYQVPGTTGASRTTDVGKQFLAYITSPIDGSMTA